MLRCSRQPKRSSCSRRRRIAGLPLTGDCFVAGALATWDFSFLGTLWSARWEARALHDIAELQTIRGHLAAGLRAAKKSLVTPPCPLWSEHPTAQEHFKRPCRAVAVSTGHHSEGPEHTGETCECARHLSKSWTTRSTCARWPPSDTRNSEPTRIDV